MQQQGDTDMTSLADPASPAAPPAASSAAPLPEFHRKT